MPLLVRVIEHARAEAAERVLRPPRGTHHGRRRDRDRRALPIRNDLASPTAYLTNARDLFDAYRAMRPRGTEVLAIYHSHPTSDPVPSRRDVEENTYGETVVHLIVGLAGAEPEVRAWWITESGFQEVEMTAS